MDDRVSLSTYGQQGHARRDAARNKSTSQARVIDNQSTDVKRACDARICRPEVCALSPHADGDLPRAGRGVRPAGVAR